MTVFTNHAAQVSLEHWQGSVYRTLSRDARVHWPARIGIQAVTLCGPYSILQATRLDPAQAAVDERCKASGCRRRWIEFDAVSSAAGAQA